LRKRFLIILTIAIILTNTLIIPHKDTTFKHTPPKCLVVDEAEPGVLIEKALIC